MKNKILLLTSIAFSFLFLPVSFVSAQLGDDILDGILGGFEYNFGYSNETISVKNITSTSITLESPVVQDGDGDDVTHYTLMYGESPFASIIDSADFSLFNSLKDKNFPSVTPVSNKVTFALNASADSLTPTKIYYVTVVPFDDDGNMGQVSATEICFQLSTQTHGEGDDCEDGTADHGSANNLSSVNMSLANIKHVIQGNNIKLTWTELAGVDKVEIYLRNTNGTTYTKLTTVNMATEQYTFDPNRNAPLSVRFIGLDSDGDQVGNEVIYTINDYTVSGSSPTPTPTPTPGIPSVPTVGPADNILWASLVAIFVFLSLTLRRRTQKH